MVVIQLLNNSKFHDVINSLQHLHLPNSKFFYKYAIIFLYKEAQKNEKRDKKCLMVAVSLRSGVGSMHINIL